MVKRSAACEEPERMAKKPRITDVNGNLEDESRERLTNSQSSIRNLTAEILTMLDNTEAGEQNSQTPAQQSPIVTPCQIWIPPTTQPARYCRYQQEKFCSQIREIEGFQIDTLGTFLGEITLTQIPEYNATPNENFTPEILTSLDSRESDEESWQTPAQQSPIVTPWQIWIPPTTQPARCCRYHQEDFIGQTGEIEGLQINTWGTFLDEITLTQTPEYNATPNEDLIAEIFAVPDSSEFGEECWQTPAQRSPIVTPRQIWIPPTTEPARYCRYNQERFSGQTREIEGFQIDTLGTFLGEITLTQIPDYEY